MRKTWIFILAVVMLAGCGGGEQQIADSGQPTAGVSATSAPSETATTMGYTRRPRPTPTIFLTPTITPTPLPSTPTPTPFSFPTPEGGEFVLSNNDWALWETYDNELGISKLIVHSLNNTRIWEVAYNDIIIGNDPWQTFISPRHWSIDGRYLYYESSMKYFGGYDLQRLDLETGQISIIIPPAFQFTSASISRNSRYLVYVTRTSVNFIDFQTGEEKSLAIDIEGDPFRNFHVLWSRDSNKVAYIIDNMEETYFLVIVDRVTMTYRAFKYETPYMYIMYWANENEIKLDGTVRGILNIETGEIREVDE